jgi:hypothetical protein
VRAAKRVRACRVESLAHWERDAGVPLDTYRFSFDLCSACSAEALLTLSKIVNRV